MRTWQKVVLTILAAVVFSSLGGCHRLRPDYGLYNLGVCSVGIDDSDFFASSVDVEAQSFSILAVATGPHSIHAIGPPVVFKYAGQKKGARVYRRQADGGEDEIDVLVSAGQLTGEFLEAGKLSAHLHGLKGTVETLGADGQREYKICQDLK